MNQLTAAANGLLTRSTYGNGAYVENTYDSYDRVIAKKYDGDQRFGYIYDANGRVYRHTDSVNNKTYTYTYDLLGRLQKTNVSDGSKIRYTYNNVNRNTGTSYTYAGATKNFAYTYFLGGLSQNATYPNGATKTRSLNGQAQVRPTSLTTPTNHVFTSTCSYFKPHTTDGVNYTTDAVGSLTYAAINRSFVYDYDGSGNISSITDTDNNTTLSNSYEYDELNQLIRENNAYLNQTVTYTYDEGGNLLTKTTYPYTTGSLDGLNGTGVSYNYSNTGWQDLLISYNGNNITYDSIGNPLSYYNGTTFTWDAGRQLATATLSDHTALSYQYNDSGIRTKKTVGGVDTDYFLDGTNIIAQKTGDDIIWFYYDGDGTREAIEYDGNVYYYFYNAQGDVMGLYDDDLNIVVAYTYDSWGKVLSITGTLASTLGVINPFRYRGYYYDTETDFYYLNSRYYDPETGRFINADSQLTTGDDILGCNLFAYCGNNPVNRIDPTGNVWFLFANIAKKVLVKAAIVIGAALLTRAIQKNKTANQKKANYKAVDKLLEDRIITNEVVKLPYDKDNLLYNKENRQYASKIIKNDLGSKTKRTVEDISSEIFAHEYAADILYPTSIFKGKIPETYDVYKRLSEADIDEHENRILIFSTMERIFG